MTGGVDRGDERSGIAHVDRRVCGFDHERGEDPRVVGEDEADIKNGMLSFASPIARALIGKTEGDVVDVDVPSGKRTLEIVEVRYI